MVLAHIELSTLEHLFKGDRALIHEWIELYLTESPKYFTQLSDSLANGDAQAMATASHDLQAQAHYIGSARMLELLMAIEEGALTNGTLACKDLLNTLLHVRHAIDAELRMALNAA